MKTISKRSTADVVSYEDAAAFAEREQEPNLSFEEVLRDLKRRGKIL